MKWVIRMVRGKNYELSQNLLKLAYAEKTIYSFYRHGVDVFMTNADQLTSFEMQTSLSV